MPELKILRRCFGYATILFAFTFATTLPVLLRIPLPHGTPRFHAGPAAILLVGMRELLLLMPPFVALVNAIAWYTLTARRPSAARWAVGACSSFLALSIPFFVASTEILPGTVAFAGVLLFALALSSIGITGIAYFARFNSLEAPRLPVEDWNQRLKAIRA